jgi:two-component system, OmpR family, heavy metal sensor histidine kinase CusS
MFWKDLRAKNLVRKRTWSLAGRLTAWYTLTALSLTFCTAALLYWALAANMSRDDALFLADKVHVLRAILRDRPDDFSALKEEVELESAARRYEQFFVRLIDENGRETMSTPGMDGLLAPQLFSAAIAADVEPGRGTEIRSPTGGQFLGVAARAVVGNSGRAWVMQIGVDRTHDEALLSEYRKWLWLVLAFAVIVSPLIGHRIAKQGIRPVQEITKTVERTGSQNLKARIEPAGYPVEMAGLAHKFNAMLDRLEEAFGRLSRFSADLAHELRTPVNNIRGEAEVTLRKGRSLEEYREALGSCLEESGRLSELIESLLFLARAESPGTQVVREPVQVIKELEAVREYYEPVAAEAGVALSVTTRDEVEADLDRVLLQRAVANLVENAVAHTPAGGTVTLAAQTNDGLLSIDISDTGAGILPEHLPHVFDRFYRADSARSSRGGHMGLGLAIVHAIVELHGGSINISSERSRGTHVTLALPMRAPQPEAASAAPRA